MNRTVNILLLVLLMVIGVNLLAQQAAKGKADSKQPSGNASSSKKIFLPPVYLGHSDLRGGAIKKDVFDNLLKQGITSHDSLGNRYKVLGFQFSYAERVVYEDSLGNLQPVTDYAYEYCPGDTITSNISGSIYDRTKPGDTLYFERVSVVRYTGKNGTQTVPEDQAEVGRPMKFYIVK